MCQTGADMSDAASDQTFPAAVLWDFDGTLVDSEPLWFAAEREFFEGHGGTWSDDRAKELIGSALIDGATTMLDHLRNQGIEVDLTREDVVRHLVESVSARLRAGEVNWRPGARELLLGLRERGIRCALVSMSYRSQLEIVVDQLPPTTFEVVVAGDEVARGKPDPEPYLLAADHLGVDISDCIVVEDSITGTTSGVRSGAAVVAVENIVPLAPGGRSVVLKTLEGFDVDGFVQAAHQIGRSA